MTDGVGAVGEVGGPEAQAREAMVASEEALALAFEAAGLTAVRPRKRNGFASPSWAGWSKT